MRSSARLPRPLAVLVLALAAQGASAQLLGLRGIRYCEVLPVYLVDGALVADVWNTTGFSQCPQADFDALDPVAIAQDLGALTVILNGPRFWVLNFVVATPSNEVMTFGNLTMRLAATLDVPAGGPAPPYAENSVNRDTEFIFFAGNEVYELVDPAGRVYVMQSYSHQVDDTLTEADLPDLGSRLQLPAGWGFRARVVSADYVVEDVAGVATVVQDDLRNSYQFVAPTLLDRDGDGVADVIDNCTDVANPGQEDVDAGEDDDSSLPGIQHYGDACDADLDNDGIAGASDFFGVFRPCLGVDPAAVPACARADLDGDGTVGASDFFGVLRPALGTAPGPGVTE